MTIEEQEQEDPGSRGLSAQACAVLALPYAAAAGGCAVFSLILALDDHRGLAGIWFGGLAAFAWRLSSTYERLGLRR